MRNSYRWGSFLVLAGVWLACWLAIMRWHFGQSSDLYAQVRLWNQTGNQLSIKLIGLQRDTGRTSALPIYYSAAIPFGIPSPYELDLPSSNSVTLVYRWSEYQIARVLVRGTNEVVRRLDLDVRPSQEDFYSNSFQSIVIPPLLELKSSDIALYRLIGNPPLSDRIWIVAFLGYFLPLAIVAYVLLGRGKNLHLHEKTS